MDHQRPGVDIARSPDCVRKLRQSEREQGVKAAGDVLIVPIEQALDLRTHVGLKARQEADRGPSMVRLPVHAHVGVEEHMDDVAGCGFRAIGDFRLQRCERRQPVFVHGAFHEIDDGLDDPELAAEVVVHRRGVARPRNAVDGAHGDSVHTLFGEQVQGREDQVLLRVNAASIGRVQRSLRRKSARDARGLIILA